MTELYLVRHAHADWTTDESRPLSDRGRRDALKIAECLAPLEPAAIHSSPYTRARQTVEPLAERLSLPIQEDPDLRERSLIAGSVSDFEDASRATWTDFDFAHPGGESNEAAQRRGVAVVQQLVYLHAGLRIVASTHGTLLALIVNAYNDHLAFDFWRGLSLPDVYLLALEVDNTATIRRVWDSAL